MAQRIIERLMELPRWLVWLSSGALLGLWWLAYPRLGAPPGGPHAGFALVCAVLIVGSWALPRPWRGRFGAVVLLSPGFLVPFVNGGAAFYDYHRHQVELFSERYNDADTEFDVASFERCATWAPGEYGHAHYDAVALFLESRLGPQFTEDFPDGYLAPETWGTPIDMGALRQGELQDGGAFVGNVRDRLAIQLLGMRQPAPPLPRPQGTDALSATPPEYGVVVVLGQELTESEWLVTQLMADGGTVRQLRVDLSSQRVMSRREVEIGKCSATLSEWARAMNRRMCEAPAE